jgi:hypothetical protein
MLVLSVPVDRSMKSKHDNMLSATISLASTVMTFSNKWEMGTMIYERTKQETGKNKSTSNH